MNRVDAVVVVNVRIADRSAVELDTCHIEPGHDGLDGMHMHAVGLSRNGCDAIIFERYQHYVGSCIGGVLGSAVQPHDSIGDVRPDGIVQPESEGILPG
ncbi:hypothetical protein Rhow_006095 [Rhodococcus wratislaviensis]|uniref:Uncharacterized protein n=1 Tax=Rhodococcus wratislaviensis TaxID=44752 RepID=A0A402CEV4_RHOWR|nr:hypothetical protein Rhow_006095 [Rhodococcus wratislaviensis]